MLKFTNSIKIGGGNGGNEATPVISVVDYENVTGSTSGTHDPIQCTQRSWVVCWGANSGNSDYLTYVSPDPTMPENNRYIVGRRQSNGSGSTNDVDTFGFEVPANWYFKCEASVAFQYRIYPFKNVATDNVTYEDFIAMTSTTATLETGKFYKWGEVSSLNISFATPQSGKLPIYAFKFTSGETAATLTINGTVTWITGGTTLEANKTYEINICDGLGVMACV